MILLLNIFPISLTSILPESNLRPAQSRQLVQPADNLRTYGFRAFSCAFPFLWKFLPREVRFSSSLSSFKNQVKTYLFKRGYEQARR